jgi:endoglucanase
MPSINDRRPTHHRWLTELTAIPTAAGHEHRVVDWITRWSAERPDLTLTRDPVGNLVLAPRTPWSDEPPIYITAHLDHPAFVVERAIAPATLELAFRGGVMDDYFPGARVAIHSSDALPLLTTITEKIEAPDSHFKHFHADLDAPSDAPRPGDVGVWDLPAPEIIDGQLHTNACDDLAAVAAALATCDELLRLAGAGEPVQNVRILFTLAEEVGFVGAIGACRNATMPADSRVIALENSRSFDDSPIGGGPIVRVGDRMSVFSPTLTGAIAKRAEEIAGGPAQPTAQQKNADRPKWRWQRKLMAGGACEATVFTAFGYEATCLCLPLGNYHNMADLTAVQAGTNTTPPRVGREHIALADFDGLVDLLIGCAQSLERTPAMLDRLERLWTERAHIIGASNPSPRPRGEAG